MSEKPPIDDFLVKLEECLPGTQWREPVSIRNLGEGREHFACRICIAAIGISGTQIENLPTDREVIVTHVAEKHVG